MKELMFLVTSILAIFGVNEKIYKVIDIVPMENKTVKIGLMGDLSLGRYVTYIAREKNDFNWSFAKISSWLKKNDLNIANLEGPIVEKCPTVAKDTFIFCGDKRFLPELKKNKFIFNMANNHIFNYGEKGFEETKKYLDEEKIINFFDDYKETEVNGIKLGFLGFDFISNPKLNEEEVLKTIKKYNKEVDWLVVSVHWGNEYLKNPEEWRKILARKMVDSGADIVHGHHPHVLQASEIYKNKIIYYSLGNFIFDQNWSKETSQSEVISLTIDKNRIISEEKLPIEIKFNSQPTFAGQE